MRLWILVLGLSTQLFAAEATLKATQPIRPPSEARILGTFELRPSYRSQIGEFHTENSAVFGYRFDRDRYVSYRQEFSTNLFEPRANVAGDVNLTATDGYFRGGINNLWRASSMPLSFNYEGRLFLPTFGLKRDAGFITALRTYLRLTYRFSPSFAVSLDEIPVIVAYDRAGSGSGSRAAANPGFENKVELVPAWNISEDWFFVVPIKYTASRYRDYQAGARFNNSWGHNLIVWPELWYTVNQNVRVGGAYYTGNLIAPDFSTTTFEQGFRTGVTQFIFAANL